MAICALLPTAALADSGHGTGNRDGDGQATPGDLGYSQAYADWKDTQAGQGVAEAGGIEPNIIPPGGGGGSYPSSFTLPFTIYHQKTDHYCLVAVGQSIAHKHFGGYVSPSVKDEQNSIASAMGTTSNGTTRSRALSWINGEFANHGDGWRYVATQSADLNTFESHGMYDLYSASLPMYVAVDLHSGYYTWYDNTPGVTHATLLVGWTSAGTYALSADPYAHPKSDGTCTTSWDSGSATNGCVWGLANGPYQTLKYFKARDPNVSGNGNPEWF